MGIYKNEFIHHTDISFERSTKLYQTVDVCFNITAKKSYEATLTFMTHKHQKRYQTLAHNFSRVS